MVYCDGCGQIKANIEREHIRLDLCKEHMSQLRGFLKTLKPLHPHVEGWHICDEGENPKDYLNYSVVEVWVEV